MIFFSVETTNILININKKRNWGFHEGGDEEGCLLGCYAVWPL
jgi:hypothetical protein